MVFDRALENRIYASYINVNLHVVGFFRIRITHMYMDERALYFLVMHSMLKTLATLLGIHESAQYISNPSLKLHD